CTILHNAVHSIAHTWNKNIPRISKKVRRSKGGEVLPPTLIIETVPLKGKVCYGASLPDHAPTFLSHKCKVVEAIAKILGGFYLEERKAWLFESREHAEHHLLLSFIVMAGSNSFYSTLAKNARLDASGWSCQEHYSIVGYTLQSKQSSSHATVVFYFVLPENGKKKFFSIGHGHTLPGSSCHQSKIGTRYCQRCCA
ncbi:MAG: hypothetical protein ACRCYP_00425, partial [Alphaproteobacteria bacterium]